MRLLRGVRAAVLALLLTADERYALMTGLQFLQVVAQADGLRDAVHRGDVAAADQAEKALSDLGAHVHHHRRGDDL